jgi:hypothetical protein
MGISPRERYGMQANPKEAAMVNKRTLLQLAPRVATDSTARSFS